MKNNFTEKQRDALIDALDIAIDTISMGEDYPDDTGKNMTEDEVIVLQNVIRNGDHIPDKYKSVLVYEFQGKLDMAKGNKNTGLLEHEEKQRVSTVQSMINALRKLEKAI